MNELVLSLRRPLPRRLDASSLMTQLADLPIAAIERLPLAFEDGEPVALGEYFTVKGSPSNDVRIVGDLAHVDGLGSAMIKGTLCLDGDVGHRIGDAMTGGRIEVTGDAGNDVGREMRGGEIVVRGNVGDRIGSGSPGSKRGMRGGEIVIFGSAGALTGACMRRGVIAIAKDVGPGALQAAIAGTLIVFGNVAAPAGRWAKRASLVALGEIAIPPSYEYCCSYQPGFVQVLLVHLQRRYGIKSQGRGFLNDYKRYAGDMAELGRGEILHRMRI